MVNHVILLRMRKARAKSESLSLDFGRRLLAEREAAGLSLATLAAKLKVTKGYLSRLESGKARPSVAMVGRIAKIIGANPDPLCILAGYLPTDVKNILAQHPVEAPTILRETFGAYKLADKPAPMTQPIQSARLLSGGYSDWTRLYEIVLSDCFDWLNQRAPNSIRAVVTDPPYGLKEYTQEEKS